MLIASDIGDCTWPVRVTGGVASVAAGSTCRDEAGSNISLLTVKELSVSSVDGWSGIASGALSLAITSPARTWDCTVSVQGRVTKSPLNR
jgi:hypothetical protein